MGCSAWSFQTNLNKIIEEMRKLDEITQEIRGNFVSNVTIQEAYGLDIAKTFDEQFSKVSIESVITFIVAFSIWVFESILNAHKTDINATIAQQSICNIPWYHAKSLAFQLGDIIVMNPDTYRFDYPVIDINKQVIKFASVRQVESDGVTVLRVYVSKENKIPLTVNELDAFTAYIREIGAAGIHYEIISQAPTNLSFTLDVVRNPMVLDSDGNRLSDGVNTVSEAISLYLDQIVYGGVFNRTKLIDAVQSADGVVDVILTAVRIGSEPSTAQNIESPGGSFVHDFYNSVITFTI